eukprot:1159955-Pelagomonas_calceolata.AAC.14
MEAHEWGSVDDAPVKRCAVASAQAWSYRAVMQSKNATQAGSSKARTTVVRPSAPPPVPSPSQTAAAAAAAAARTAPLRQRSAAGAAQKLDLEQGKPGMRGTTRIQSTTTGTGCMFELFVTQVLQPHPPSPLVTTPSQGVSSTGSPTEVSGAQGASNGAGAQVAGAMQ